MPIMSSQEIQTRQNEMKFLKIQYAARRCFNAAENYNYFAWLACIVSAFSIFLPDAWHTFIVNGIPFIFDFVAAIFCALTQKNVYWAAYLRKYFDANVIGINPGQFSKSEEQNILEKAETVFSAHSHDGLIQIRNTGHDVPPGVKDWYEFSTPLNAVEAQFECQKQNIWWNKKMSQRKIPITIFVGISIIAGFGFSMHILNRSILTTLLCSSGIILKLFERVYENIKYIQVSLQIDGSKETIEIQPEEKYVEHLQSLIDERRGINVLELNSIHKKVAAKLSALYSKSS